ncbi:antitoxin Xre/MbcA/ParS toxin-binding domain-containing protein [Aquiflexum lacus]|uniref:antitoxin Xre/MbcA/ParS toxin-binding domain-containing protein n=1 Tax=Aquiflexum lacus TaxID=2483805 RepID=UPI001895143D|nr:antitoxin Xre/MbcA/ParS toxin-binding domain-containing protein [Aquiflexum lacus]
MATKKTKFYREVHSEEENIVSDLQYEAPYGSATSFKVKRSGHSKSYHIPSGGYGYFVSSFTKAGSMAEVGELLDQNLLSEDISAIVDFLDFKIQDIAKAASVSPSTVSRWDNKSPIGTPGSYQFFKIDEVIKKGVDLFGNTAYLKQWLDSPNMALGNDAPIKLITSMIGLELVDEALDALHFGNVM